jgi:hypothetical protein
MSKRMPDSARIHRILALCRKDAAALERVIARLFSTPATGDRLAALDTDENLAERVDAFAARFGRLQDALSDKLLPAYFDLVEEPPRPVVEMLDRAERLGLVSSADEFIEARKLRNRLVHEYVENRDELAANLNTARKASTLLTTTLVRVAEAITRREQTP